MGNSPQAAVGEIASVTVSKGVVTYPSSTNVAQFQFYVYQVINGTRVLMSPQPSFALSAEPENTIVIPNRTFSTQATSTNPSGAFQVRNGSTYDIEIKHPNLNNPATGLGCIARFVVPNTGTSFVLSDSSFATASSRILERISFPCNVTTSPTTSVSASPVTVDGVLPAICSKPKLDVMLVMDNSASMDDTDAYRIMKNTIGAIQTNGKYQSGDRLGGVRYSWDEATNDAGRTHTNQNNSDPDQQLGYNRMQLSADTLARSNELITTNYLDWSATGDAVAPGLRHTSAYLRANRASDATGIILFFYEGETDVPAVGTDLYNSLMTQITADKDSDIYYYAIGLNAEKTVVNNLVQAGGGINARLNTTDPTLRDTTINSIFNHINNRYADCVSVTMETSKQLVRPGNSPKNNFDVTFTVRNGRRDQLVNGILLLDPLPAGLVSSTATSRIRIPLPVMARGEVRSLTETITVNN